MTTNGDFRLPQTRGFGETARRDRWWVQPTVVFLALSAFIVYATFRALENGYHHYEGGGAQYLSPFYSPLLFDVPGDPSGHAWFGDKPSWWPALIPFFPAFFILWGPGGMRFTCYYYRGAYYKAFWADPPNCAVGEPRKGYRGERSFPLIMQNIHRYFFYPACAFIAVLAWDGFVATRFTGADGSTHFGVGLGTIIICMNAILLGGYTFGCHCMRHLIGGRLNALAGKPIQRACYDCVSALNKRHMLWAWSSLVWVGFTDFYIRMCASGAWTDWRIF
ncbi:MAG: hypothetical protein KDA25_02380 [Phycisphaerales bacterium]|nr:hypothetical protein [Phycisphaerales bacterium]